MFNTLVNNLSLSLWMEIINAVNYIFKIQLKCAAYISTRWSIKLSTRQSKYSYKIIFVIIKRSLLELVKLFTEWITSKLRDSFCRFYGWDIHKGQFSAGGNLNVNKYLKTFQEETFLCMIDETGNFPIYFQQYGIPLNLVFLQNMGQILIFQVVVYVNVVLQSNLPVTQLSPCWIFFLRCICIS